MSDLNVPFSAPLNELDSETETYGCRQTNPYVCSRNGIPGVCAFASEDHICRRPSKRWREQYKKLSREEKKRADARIHKGQSLRLLLYQSKRVGEKGKNNRGVLMEIVAYRGATDIDVLFETGELVTGKTYESFKKGEIRCPSGYSYTHEGEKRKNNQGLEMEIVACRDSMHLDVRFDTGEIVKNRTYIEFKSGAIKCPSAMSLERVGEKNVNHQGLEMEIIEYRNRKDMKVRFETGDVVHANYYDFKAGTTGCPSFFKQKRVGERNVNTQGFEMEIVEYHGCNNIDVKFSTGDIVTDKRYSNFKKGMISFPFK